MVWGVGGGGWGGGWGGGGGEESNRSSAPGIQFFCYSGVKLGESGLERVKLVKTGAHG